MHRNVPRTLAVIVIAGGISLASFVLADTTTPALSVPQTTPQPVPVSADVPEVPGLTLQIDTHSTTTRQRENRQGGERGDKTVHTPESPKPVSVQASTSPDMVVAPNAFAPRILLGDASTQQDVQATAESLKFIEQMRSAREHATSTGERIRQIEDHPATGTVQSFIQAIVQNITQSAPVPALPEREGSRQGTGASTSSGPFTTVTSSATGSSESREGVRVPAALQVHQLEQIGQNIRAIDTAKLSVQKQVSDIVTRRVDQTVSDAVRQTTANTAPSTNVSDTAQREEKLQQIRVDATAQGQQIAAQVSQSVLQGAMSPQQVNPVLDSSLQGIARTVQAQSGLPVSVPTTPLQSRDVVDTIETATQNIQTNQSALAQRDGLDLYRDTDHDGISDYDEVHIYHTDPNNAYTSGGPLTDGERILLGLDPLSTSTAPVPVENPKTSGVQTNALFEVTNIAVVPAPANASPVLPTPAEIVAQVNSTSSVRAISPVATSTPQIRFSGRALPNSFVTLYIFSTPVVVTVKTDSNGLWTYSLDKSLPDGTHELYVATVDDGGKILAKSPAIPFVKTAEALDFQPLTVQTVSDPTPFDVIRENLLASAGLLLLLFALVAVVSLGFRRGGSILPQ